MNSLLNRATLTKLSLLVCLIGCVQALQFLPRRPLDEDRLEASGFGLDSQYGATRYPTRASTNPVTFIEKEAERVRESSPLDIIRRPLSNLLNLGRPSEQTRPIDNLSRPYDPLVGNSNYIRPDRHERQEIGRGIPPRRIPSRVPPMRDNLAGGREVVFPPREDLAGSRDAVFSRGENLGGSREVVFPVQRGPSRSCPDIGLFC